eukprot:64464-Prymnesium_polylepis.2
MSHSRSIASEQKTKKVEATSTIAPEAVDVTDGLAEITRLDHLLITGMGQWSVLMLIRCVFGYCRKATPAQRDRGSPKQTESASRSYCRRHERTAGAKAAP